MIVKSVFNSSPQRCTGTSPISHQILGRRSPWAFMFLLIGCGILLSGTALANMRSLHHDRLRELKNDLEEKRQALRNYHKEEKSLILLVSELDQSLSSIWVSYDAALERQTELESELSILQAQLEKDENAFELVSDRLQKRLRAIYVLGRNGGIRHIFGAESFRDLSFRRSLVKRVANHDVKLVNQRATMLQRISKQRQKVADNLKEAEQVAAQIREQAELMQSTRAERAALISEIQTKKDVAMRSVQEIVTEQQDIKRVLFRLIREKKRSGVPRRFRGVDVFKSGLLWPVQGQIIRSFGVSRDKKTRAKWVSNGLHLQSPLGTPIVAPAEGEVVYVGWMKGFGQIVILDHDDGIHALLAHLSRATVERGEKVNAGQVIGFSGDTGSLEGSKLYFELRSKGKPINPLRFLKQ